MYWIRIIALVIGLPQALLSSSAIADDGGTIVREQCATCHRLQDEPGDDATARLDRRAPPLYFAGNKFREEWLQDWLQAPEALRPAGYFPAVDVQQTEDGDRVDPDSLPAHPALSEAEATAVAGYLMTLTARQDLIDADSYEPGTVSPRMGMMDFRKFKGCNACHQDAPDKGGVSGPTLHDAWQRLQPAYLSSFISDPTAWDPGTIMPVPDMNESAVHRLVHYLRAIGGDES